MMLATIEGPLRTGWLAALCVLAGVMIVTFAVHHRRMLAERHDALMAQLVVRLSIDTSAFTEGLRQASRAMREVGTTAAFARHPLAVFGQQLGLQLDEANAAMYLTAVAPLGMLWLLGAEVDRRAQTFSELWAHTPITCRPPMTPRAAALRSVADDVTHGRLA